MTQWIHVGKVSVESGTIQIGDPCFRQELHEAVKILEFHDPDDCSGGPSRFAKASEQLLSRDSGDDRHGQRRIRRPYSQVRRVDCRGERGLPCGREPMRLLIQAAITKFGIPTSAKALLASHQPHC